MLQAASAAGKRSLSLVATRALGAIEFGFDVVRIGWKLILLLLSTRFRKSLHRRLNVDRRRGTFADPRVEVQFAEYCVAAAVLPAVRRLEGGPARSTILLRGDLGEGKEDLTDRLVSVANFELERIVAVNCTTGSNYSQIIN